MTKKPHLYLYLIMGLLFLTVSCKTAQEPVIQSKPETRVANTQQDWQTALKTSFREQYNKAVDSHAVRMHREYPVITQDLLNMTLILSNGEKVPYKMDKKAYFTLAHTTHPVLTIYSILYQSDFKPTESTMLALEDYILKLVKAQEGIKQVTHLNEKQKDRIRTLLATSEVYVQHLLDTKETHKKGFTLYSSGVRRMVEGNLYDGAKEQLDQFKAQMEKWKTEYPNENWEDLRVVVMGFHQARDLYALKLFFQWLLKEPDFEKKVVFAEYQFSIFGDQKEKAEELALLLLTKVDFEKEPSLFLLGNETQLQKDVMGPAAQKILKAWGQSDWE